MKTYTLIICIALQVCIYQYDANDPGDLSIAVGEEIEVQDTIEDHWCVKYLERESV